MNQVKNKDDVVEQIANQYWDVQSYRVVGANLHADLVHQELMENLRLLFGENAVVVLELFQRIEETR